MKMTNLLKPVVLALLLSTTVAEAQIPAEFANDPIVLQIAEKLAAQGYEITEVKITLLGRYKIDAVADGYEREIVIAAGGGTVLRDEWHATDGTTSSGGTSETDNSSDEGSDNGSSDDSSNDDNSDDSSNDDNSDDGSNDGSSDDGSDDGSSDDSSDDGSDDDSSDDDSESEGTDES